uniref:Intraflagellar transport protein 46 homolog n=1 Tax=Syphacia muris TaxID=451379 RepID=A0A0N5AKL8_9BILA
MTALTLKEIMDNAEAYVPKDIDIESDLVPFTLEYVPAIGEVDPFLSIPRPDQVNDNLGLTVLDEPAVEQTDPAIFDLRLRNEAKDVRVAEAPVKKLANAERKTAEIDQWINNIKVLIKSIKKPSDIVRYSNPMPDIERLMQEWPAAIEDLLTTEYLPSASIDATLEQYIDICLAFFDIPVQKSRIQSLHVLFTLFSEFHNSQHFRNLAERNFSINASTEHVADRLEL